ncbi:unnamed protein product [Ceutorhynchus assimilis]|uniref:Uncharacterized protein n=1 Tax=Ceutorhynchus assimilis TaxID=467358 RepID=A0A9N9Q8J8_9CUCU|nr:unnamed protein product [Ceutorhynchus assimilis]
MRKIANVLGEGPSSFRTRLSVQHPPPDYHAVFAEMTGGNDTTLERLMNLQTSPNALTATEVALILRKSFRGSRIRSPTRSTAEQFLASLSAEHLVDAEAPIGETFYTIATGAGLAKFLRQSIRRSMRKIVNVLGEGPSSSRTRPSVQHPPPDYHAVFAEMTGGNDTTLERLMNLQTSPNALTATEVALILRKSFRGSRIRSPTRSTAEQFLASLSAEHLVDAEAPIGETFYTIATGAGLAKFLRQSIRRSMRKIANVLGEGPSSFRTRLSVQHPPPDYHAVFAEMTGGNDTTLERLMNLQTSPNALTATEVALIHRKSFRGSRIRSPTRSTAEQFLASLSAEHLVDAEAPIGETLLVPDSGPLPVPDQAPCLGVPLPSAGSRRSLLCWESQGFPAGQRASSSPEPS